LTLNTLYLLLSLRISGDILHSPNKKRTLFTSTLNLELRKKLVKCYVWSIALYGAETWTLRAVDQKHLEVLKCGVGEG
jgi:hypothetical protein